MYSIFGITMVGEWYEYEAVGENLSKREIYP